MWPGLAADRSVFAAEQAQEPLMAAAGDFRLGHAFLAEVDRTRQNEPRAWLRRLWSLVRETVVARTSSRSGEHSTLCRAASFK